MCQHRHVPGATDSRQQRAGFTLIEVLVVMAVIAVLMAVLIPTLGMARQYAKQVRCMTQLSQIAKAWQLYLDDHHGRFYQGINANLNYGGWRGLREWSPRPLNRFINLPLDANEAEAGVFRCSADRGGVPGGFFHETAYRCNGTSYQTNLFLIGQDKCGAFSERTAELDAQISARLAEMGLQKVTASPALLLLIGDYGWINQWKPSPYPRPEYKTQAEWHGRPDRHSMAFLDGHVELIRIRKGIYVADAYTVLPFKDLHGLASKIQDPNG